MFSFLMLELTNGVESALLRCLSMRVRSGSTASIRGPVLKGNFVRIAAIRHSR